MKYKEHTAHFTDSTQQKTSFRLTPTAILFGYTRSFPRDLGNVGYTKFPKLRSDVSGIRTQDYLVKSPTL